MGFYEKSYELQINKFKVGDKVMLNSGGPVMTISKYDVDFNKFWCKWPCSKEELSWWFKMFTPECLTLIEPNKFLPGDMVLIPSFGNCILLVGQDINQSGISVCHHNGIHICFLSPKDLVLIERPFENV